VSKNRNVFIDIFKDYFFNVFWYDFNNKKKLILIWSMFLFSISNTKEIVGRAVPNHKVESSFINSWKLIRAFMTKTKINKCIKSFFLLYKVYNNLVVFSVTQQNLSVWVWEWWVLGLACASSSFCSHLRSCVLQWQTPKVLFLYSSLHKWVKT